MIKNLTRHINREKYIFTLEQDFEFKHQLFMNVNFNSEWLQIFGGVIFIPKGYSWDGCTPKIKIAGKLVIGTPDGEIHPETGKPRTYYASLVHDALYQYFPQHGISRKDIDSLFLDMLRMSGFKSAGLYHRAVRWFGGIFIALTR